MIKMDEQFEMLRGERRSFFCHNKLWKELQKKTADKISISTYIKQAIIEKMVGEDIDNKEYYNNLIRD